MAELLGSIWWLIVTLGLLVTFHEFGHYWVARRCGVRVLRFSVGFGNALWKHKAKNGTEFWISTIPLGGYVKMLDARESEVAPEARGEEFSGQPVWKRIAIVIAGPAFNLVFALAAFWLMFTIGKPDYAPVVAPAPQSLAAQAGVQAGERIIAVDGAPVATWTEALERLSGNVLLRQPAALRVQAADGSEATRTLALDRLTADEDMGQALRRIGLALQGPEARIGTVAPDSPAAAAGLRPGDRILTVDGTAVDRFADLARTIGAAAAADPQLTLQLRRGTETLSLPVTARRDTDPDGTSHWRIGVAPPPFTGATLRYGPLRAIPAAFATTWEKTALTFRMVGGMITGQSSTRNLSGIITIAQVANTSAHMGVAWFLDFLGLISLSLAILNILPIPLLDGGHLLYYLVELVKGSPVSENAMIAGQYIGLVLLAALMGLAFYNDILRLVG